MIDDPQLKGVSALLFDEFHERHLYGDITLARALDLQEQHRPGPETRGDVRRRSTRVNWKNTFRLVPRSHPPAARFRWRWNICRTASA
jgi:hypothetical protein